MPRHTATLHKQEESKHGGAPGRGTRPSDDALNRTNRQRLDALSRRYPGKLELRAPNGATPIHLRMQAQAASRLDHIEALVTFTAAGATGSRLVSMGPDQNLGPRGLSPPGPGGHPLRAGLGAGPQKFVLLPAARPDDRELSTDSHPRSARVLFV